MAGGRRGCGYGTIVCRVSSSTVLDYFFNEIARRWLLLVATVGGGCTRKVIFFSAFFQGRAVLHIRVVNLMLIFILL